MYPKLSWEIVLWWGKVLPPHPFLQRLKPWKPNMEGHNWLENKFVEIVWRSIIVCFLISFGKSRFKPLTSWDQRRYDMNGRSQMQRSKNWILPEEINANRFFWDSHWLEIWKNHLCPSMGPNGGSVAMESAVLDRRLMIRCIQRRRDRLFSSSDVYLMVPSF
jgi:hypothetical protein